MAKIFSNRKSNKKKMWKRSVRAEKRLKFQRSLYTASERV